MLAQPRRLLAERQSFHYSPTGAGAPRSHHVCFPKFYRVVGSPPARCPTVSGGFHCSSATPSLGNPNLVEGAASKTVWASPVAPWVKNACNAGDTGDLGSTPGAGRSPGEGNGSLLLYFCLKNPMDRGVWWATVRKGGKEPDATRYKHKKLSTLCLEKFLIALVRK